MRIKKDLSCISWELMKQLFVMGLIIERIGDNQEQLDFDVELAQLFFSNRFQSLNVVYSCTFAEC